MVTIFDFDGLSAEALTEVRRRVAAVVEGDVGTIGTGGSRFRPEDATLVIETFAAIVAAIALFVQLRDRRAQMRSHERESDQVKEAIRSETTIDLTDAELHALAEAAKASGTTGVTIRTIEARVTVRESVVEIRGRATSE